jgi:hypothetical protein
MTTFAGRERSSIGRASINAWMEGTGIDTSRFQGFYFSFKEKIYENFEYKNKELFYSIKKKK